MLSITHVEIISRSASGNSRPRSGYVTFSDDKYYHFFWVQPNPQDDGEWVFGGFRTRCGVNERFSVRSEKRAKLLTDYLNGDYDFSIKPFKIKLQ